MITLYTVIQLTWGIIQNILGYILFMINITREHYLYRGSIVTVWGKHGSMCLGLFIFMDKNADIRVLNHEYGHSIQSCILGPLYLIVIGIPSYLWANIQYLRNYRDNKRVSYYTFYPERWANHLSRKYLKLEVPEIKKDRII